jgi:hypothetical protein
MGRPPSCLCGECQKCKHRAYMREWYARVGPQYAREMSRKHRARAREYERARYANDQEFRRVKLARNAAVQAIARGTITRGPCEKCGASPAEAHHDDYARPLEVRWLCKHHHEEHHALQHLERLRA